MRWNGWYCSREIGTSWRICKQSWWRYIGMLPCRSLQRRITSQVATCSHFKRTHTFLLFAWGAMFRNQLGALMKKPRSHNHWSWSPWQVEYYVKHRRYAFCSGDLTGFVSGSEQSINDGTVSRLLEETWTDSWNIQTMDWLCSPWCTRFIIYLYLNWKLESRVAALKMIGPLFRAFWSAYVSTPHTKREVGESTLLR